MPHTRTHTTSTTPVAVSLKTEAGDEMRLWITERLATMPTKFGFMLPKDATCAQVHAFVAQGLEADLRRALASQELPQTRRTRMTLSLSLEIRQIQNKGRPLPADATPVLTIIAPGDDLVVDGVLGHHMTVVLPSCTLL